MKIGKLKNGMSYVIDKNGSKYSVNIVFIVGTGSRFEEKKKYGLAHFLEHMLFKGTKKRKTSKDISDEIYSLGAETNAMTTYDVTSYYITTSSKYIENQLDILSDMLFNSKFNGIKSEKDVVINENDMNQTSPDDKLTIYFTESVFKNTSFEHDAGGINKEIKKFTKKDVINFYNKFYSPNNIVLSICGKVPKNIESLVKKYFDKKRKNISIEKKLYKNFIDIQKNIRFKSIKQDVEQAQIMLGFPSYSYRDKKYPVLQVISSVLGGNMSSRLFSKLREKLGLVYSVSSEVEGFQDIGLIGIKFGTFVNQVEKAVNAVINEIISIKKKGITKQELKNNVNYILGTNSINQENNENCAYLNGYEYLLYGNIISHKQKEKIYKSITLKQIKEVANEIFKYDKLNIVILSNKKYKNFIKKF